MRVRHLKIRGQYTGTQWLYTVSSYAEVTGTGASYGEEKPRRISKRTAEHLVGWIDVAREDNWEAFITVTYN